MLVHAFLRGFDVCVPALGIARVNAGKEVFKQIDAGAVAVHALHAAFRSGLQHGPNHVLLAVQGQQSHLPDLGSARCRHDPFTVGIPRLAA